MSLLEVNDVTQRFGGLQALSEFNLQLEERELIGLIGPNGAGKTTVFNIVSGFYQPTEGSVIFAGTPTKGLKPHEVTALGLARTFQNIRLWNDMSVLDNVRIAQYHRLGYSFAGPIFLTKKYQSAEKRVEDKAREILTIMGLSEYMEELPSNLPYGLQRRVELARALSLDPKLLLLDEPAAGLNSSDIAELIRLIRWIYETFPISIWMIEHQMEVVMTLCQRIEVIDFGKSIARGTPDEIRRNPVVISAYLGDEVV